MKKRTISAAIILTVSVATLTGCGTTQLEDQIPYDVGIKRASFMKNLNSECGIFLAELRESYPGEKITVTPTINGTEEETVTLEKDVAHSFCSIDRINVKTSYVVIEGEKFNDFEGFSTKMTLFVDEEAQQKTVPLEEQDIKAPEVDPEELKNSEIIKEETPEVTVKDDPEYEEKLKEEGSSSTS